MTIHNFHVEDNGDISFLVDSEKYEEILAHLRAKGISVGGRDTNDPFCMIVVGVSPDKVNEALQDFDE